MYDKNISLKISEYIKDYYKKNKAFPSIKKISSFIGIGQRTLEVNYGQTGFLIYSASPELYNVFIKTQSNLIKKRKKTELKFEQVKKNYPTIEFLTPIFGLKQRMDLKCLVCNEITNRPLERIVDGSAKNLCEPCKEKKKSKSGESVIRDYFESFFEEPFKKTKHPKLINTKTNMKLELDGYNEKLNLAFEYRGSVHYSKSFFHKNDESLQSLQYRNEIKEELCKKNGINLIIVPNLNWFLESNNFQEWFKKELTKLNIPIKKEIPPLEFEVKPFFSIKRSLFKEEVLKIYEQSKIENLSAEDFYLQLVKAVSS